MKKILFSVILFTSFLLFGCDSVYRYVFMPPERIEFMLVPDMENMKLLNDTTYRISKDSLTIIMDKKDYKIELKYITDFQLNTYEFPDDSKGEFYSKNPYTYGDWIDPSKGYTPNRFTIFKITVYNYSGSKINFNPELSLLETDRGDKLNAYGREKKDARYQSLEEYYLRRKGASGIDDEVFESRMGIARRTMIYLGKPIYAGDFREGFIVFDPIDESVEKIKVSLNDFILGYNENNEPDVLANFSFYFDRAKFNKSLIVGKTALDTVSVAVSTVKDTGYEFREVNITQLQYTTSQSRYGSLETWNPIPQAIPEFINYMQAQTKMTGRFSRLTIDAPKIPDANMLIFLGGFGLPDISSVMINNLADYLSKGGFLFIDNSYVSKEWPYYSTMLGLLEQISKKISAKGEIKRIALDHPIFSIKNKFTDLPKGYDDFNVQATKSDFIEGLFIDGKLAAVLSSKGYIPQWAAAENKTDALNFGVNLIYYALDRKK